MDKRHVSKPTLALLITGSRTAPAKKWRETIVRALRATLGYEDYGFVTFIHGAAPGIDTLADKTIREEAEDGWIPNLALVGCKADWNRHGKSAGPIRNREMLEMLKEYWVKGATPHVLAFHDDLTASKGTKHMVNIAFTAGVNIDHWTSEGTVRRIQEPVRWP